MGEIRQILEKQFFICFQRLYLPFQKWGICLICLHCATAMVVSRSHHESCTVITVTWLTDTEYLCHKLALICCVCRNHNPVLSSFMAYHQVCNKSNITSDTRVAETVYSSWARELAPGFSGVHVTLSLVFYIIVCSLSLSLFYWPLCCFSFDLRLPITPLVS